MKIFSGLCFTIAAFLCFPSCSHSVIPTGTYRQTAVTADGNLNEWERPLRFTSNGGMVQYNVTNDDKNVYVALETHDAATAKKILHAGVHIYIDPAGGESKKISLAYPLPNTYIPVGEGNKPHNNAYSHNAMQADSFNITGFLNLSDGRYPASTGNKIKIALKTAEDHSLAYEAVIPLQYIYADAATSNPAGRQITVGIVVNAMKGGEAVHKPNPGTASMSGMGGGRGGGMHGGGGGRGGGGGHRGSSAATEDNANTMPTGETSLTKQDSNWYKFKLAGK